MLTIEPQRRTIVDLTLVFKILNQFVNRPEILEPFKLYAARIPN